MNESCLSGEMAEIIVLSQSWALGPCKAQLRWKLVHPAIAIASHWGQEGLLQAEMSLFSFSHQRP